MKRHKSKQMHSKPSAIISLGERRNKCCTCSPMYVKVSIFLVFSTFRTALSSYECTAVVRSLSLPISGFLDFSNKGRRNNFQHAPILAFLRKTRNKMQLFSRHCFPIVSQKERLRGSDEKREYFAPGSNTTGSFNTLYVCVYCFFWTFLTLQISMNKPISVIPIVVTTHQHYSTV